MNVVHIIFLYSWPLTLLWLCRETERYLLCLLPQHTHVASLQKYGKLKTSAIEALAAESPRG